MRNRLAPHPIRRSRLLAGLAPVACVLGLSFLVWFGTEMGAVASKERPGEVRMTVNHAVLTKEDMVQEDDSAMDEAPLDQEQVPTAPGSVGNAAAENDDADTSAAKAPSKENADKAAVSHQDDTPNIAKVAGPSFGTFTGISQLGASADTPEGATASGMTLLAKLSQKADKVTWFYLPESGRLIIDIHGRRTTMGPPVYRFDSGPVQHVVVGEHPDRLRLAVVFRTPLPQSVKPVLKPVADGLNIFLPAS